MNLRYVIAIDGPSGAGKSTVARLLAERLGYTYIDTGAMYRAAALFADRRGVDISDREALENLLESLHISQEMQDAKVVTLLHGEDVSERIRSADMGMKASAISAAPAVREKLLALQRSMGENGGVVMEGRDITTVVFPDADYKFFLTASKEERARRRCEELVQRGQETDFNTVLQEINIRDENDSTRAAAPLRRADDALEIDTTDKSVEEVVSKLKEVISSPLRDKE